MRIKNWAKFQHYKHRNPPWVKLHFEILSSPDWVMLDDASKLLAVVCILIASRHDGEIPQSCTPAYFKRIAYLDKLPNFKPLIDCGFLIEVQADASICEQVQAIARPETETEKKEYYFEDGPIRLNKADFEKWRDAFPNIDLKAELIGLSAWAATQANWFHAVKGALAKRNREHKPQPDKPKTDILNPTDRRSAWGLP